MQDRTQRLALNQGCVRCHAEVAVAWHASSHRSAATDGYFRRALALEPSPFCRGCHAPEADPLERDVTSREASIGVACVTCHLVGDTIVSTRPHRATGDDADHDVVGDPRWGTPEVCGGCHQFEFPHSPREWMQRTLSEHAESPLSGVSCQDCHMPRDDSHRFALDLGAAVEIAVGFAAPGQLEVTLRRGRVGHAVPTGDMNRVLELRAQAIGPGGEPRGAVARRAFRRTFGVREGRRVQTADDRLTDARTFTLDLDPSTNRARWQLVWQRFAPELAERHRMDMRRHEHIVAEGITMFAAPLLGVPQPHDESQPTRRHEPEAPADHPR